jgi:DNA-binding NarL/FixJ family response regulator
MMDDMDGYELIDHLMRSEKHRSIPLFFLTARTGPEDKLLGLSKGAIDFINKPFSLEELKAKIRVLIRYRKTGRESVIKEVQEKMAALIQPRDREDDTDRIREENFRRFKITKRGQEIIRFLIQGLEYKEIADRLSISINTVKPYIREIYKKCGVKNKMELIGVFKTNWGA